MSRCVGILLFLSVFRGFASANRVYPSDSVRRIFHIDVNAALIINKGIYDGLPPELQTILHEVGKEWTARADAGQQEAYEMAYGGVPQDFAGAETFELTREEQQKWANAMPNIAKEWADQMEAQGLPGKEVLAAYMEEMRSSGADPVRNWDQE